MTGATVLAIDAGQSGMKVRIETGERREQFGFGGIHTGIELLPQLAQVVHEATARSGVAPDLVTAGVSGLTDREADAGALLDLIRRDGVQGVVLAHDSTTSFLGALGDRPGVVVASGTGVVTLGVGRATTARVDGWGWIMGDAGSGYWIGREALDAVMRAFDGRGPATTLTDVARGLWPDLTQAYMELQANHDRVRVVASMAREVAAAAEAGDAVALDICARAADELAHSVRTAASAVRTDEMNLPVCAIGGVFSSAPLRAAFTRALDADAHLTLVDPAGVGIDGAVALARLDPRHPLGAVVHRAGTV
ncbi:N-acetylglucosamine kinase [Microbacterium sp. NPDC091382]|uniref:N-acetylglucosamine kinase n=1 Tax=Microbacterium sp. NPDC091382 TaxID=3364210 RepID=UPI0037F346F3